MSLRPNILKPRGEQRDGQAIRNTQRTWFLAHRDAHRHDDHGDPRRYRGSNVRRIQAQRTGRPRPDLSANGPSAQRTYYVDYQAYSTDVAILRKIESQLAFNTTDARQSGVMAAVGGTPANQAVVLVSTSQSGNQFCLMNVATTLTAGVNGQTAPGTYYKKNPAKVTTSPDGGRDGPVRHLRLPGNRRRLEVEQYVTLRIQAQSPKRRWRH